MPEMDTLKQNQVLGPLWEPDREALSKQTANLVDRGFLAPGPEEAAERVKQAGGGGSLTSDGKNNEVIKALRDGIHEIYEDLAPALLLVAAHTHWEQGDYILEQYEGHNDQYLIGPSKTLPRAPALPIVPISFVFCEGGPAAYEWTDARSGLLKETLTVLWEGVWELNRKVVAQFSEPSAFPVGVSINHRFKDVWQLPRTSTNERPAEGESEYAVVRRGSTGGVEDDETGSVQVGWSALSEVEYSDREQRALEALERELSALSSEEADTLLEELEAYARYIARAEE